MPSPILRMDRAFADQPLTCMPMITGHNCFGAVLYPITMADFVIADVTDASHAFSKYESTKTVGKMAGTWLVSARGGPKWPR